MNKKDIIFGTILIIIYCLIILFVSPQTLNYRYDYGLIEKYLHSQDIPHEVKNRIFLSDSDIHIASGVLYVKGNDVTQYNFQHPPVIKYLFGLFSLYLKNPFLVQALFSLIYIIAVYIFARLMKKGTGIAFFTAGLLMIDPVFLSMQNNALLDLGQAVFALLYFIAAVFFTSNWFAGGLILALFAGSKFWSTAILFFLLIHCYLFFQHKLKIRLVIYQITTALIIFNLFYLSSYLKNHFLFNIIFFQLKILKYWFNHSLASIPFASLIMFITGFYRQWWSDGIIARIKEWTLFYPAGFITLFIELRSFKKISSIKINQFVAVLPIFYIIYLGVQVPFSRYFLIILPFFYYVLVVNMDKFLKRFFFKFFKQFFLFT